MFDVGIRFQTTPRPYDGFIMPIHYLFERKVHGKWVGFSSVAPHDVDSLYDDDCAWAGAKLPRGTFRVRAKFQDAAHPKPAYNKWKTIVSK